jgi:hypothetical protein
MAWTTYLPCRFNMNLIASGARTYGDTHARMHVAAL